MTPSSGCDVLTSLLGGGAGDDEDGVAVLCADAVVNVVVSVVALGPPVVADGAYCWRTLAASSYTCRRMKMLNGK